MDDLEALIAALPEDVRDRVVERAAILWESGVPDEDATRRAYEMESGRTLASSSPASAAPKPQVLAGLARARDRSRESDDEPTGSTGSGTTG